MRVTYITLMASRLTDLESDTLHTAPWHSVKLNNMCLVVNARIIEASPLGVAQLLQ